MKLWRNLILACSSPIILADYFSRSTGSEYGVGLWRKLWLAAKMVLNYYRIETHSHPIEHLTMATYILRIPKDLRGCLVECGTCKGGSAANLSLVAKLCGRQLHVFDSFAGLPKEAVAEAYQEGEFCGALVEVEANIRRCGVIDVCTFHTGLFKHTLPTFNDSVVLAFLDVDLTGSLKDCLKSLWPLLQPGCHLFTHEARGQTIFSIFFDSKWWQNNVAAAAPGLIGAGTGLGLIPLPGGFGSDLGYTIKAA